MTFHSKSVSGDRGHHPDPSCPLSVLPGDQSPVRAAPDGLTLTPLAHSYDPVNNKRLVVKSDGIRGSGAGNGSNVIS